MKWLIASDIHGSAYYCEKLLTAYRRERADRILLLGDILYHGPRNDLPKEYDPKRVMEMLNEIENDIVCVRGNCDAEVDQMILNFPIMADYAIINVGKHIIFATHGHIYNNENLPPIHEDDIILHGHTHIPVCEKFATHTFINPGSVSIPKANSPHSYMTFEGTVFEWKNIEGKAYKKYCIS